VCVITCASCGTENPEGARFCNSCGSALASAVQARAKVDLGRAMSRNGEAREVLERARQILLECDAKLFLFEVDEALAEANA
jgi:uncharacterized membrane protein YvbJ